MILRDLPFSADICAKLSARLKVKIVLSRFLPPCLPASLPLSLTISINFGLLLRTLTFFTRLFLLTSLLICSYCFRSRLLGPFYEAINRTPPPPLPSDSKVGNTFEYFFHELLPRETGLGILVNKLVLNRATKIGAYEQPGLYLFSLFGEPSPTFFSFSFILITIPLLQYEFFLETSGD